MMNTSDADATFMCLYEAFEAGENEVIYAIFDNGFKIPENKKMISLLGLAASHGNAELISYLLDKKILDVNEQDSLYNYTALHQAAIKNNECVTQLLLSYDADPNIQGKNGLTPLHIAFQYNHINVVIALVESGKIKDINARIGPNGEPILREALRCGYTMLVLSLLKHGADPNVLCDKGCALLHFYNHCIHNKINENVRTNIIAALIASGKIDANAKSSRGNTVLHEALRCDYTDLVLLLLDNNLIHDISAKDSQGKTPLHLALSSQNVNEKVIHDLLEKGADANAKDSQGNTPLHLALSSQNVNTAIIHNLLEKGADANAKDFQGNTSLHLAVCHYINVTIIHDLLEKGADVNAKDSQGKTPLHYAACRFINITIVRTLLEKGADVNAKDSQGKTPVDVAQNSQNNKIVKILTAKIFRQIGNDEIIDEYIAAFEMNDEADDELDLKRQTN